MGGNIVYFVKPHPPAAVLRRRCPIPENYRYDWEPLVLKYLAFALKREDPTLEVRIWHLMDEKDDRDFLAAAARERPRAVFFTELDIYVSQVNRLAGKLKALCPRTVTAVGGKQTSLLEPGDRLPFTDIDFAVGGDGVAAVREIVSLTDAPGAGLNGRCLAWDKKTGIVTAARRNPRDRALALLAADYRMTEVVNHSSDEYVSVRQRMPALAAAAARTAPILLGTGCPYRCVFCQSPRDFGPDDRGYLLRDPAAAAEEMALVARAWGVNHFFSIESNVDLEHLLCVYAELEKRGTGSLPVSGFVRSPDLLAAHRQGLLPELARRGFRFVHTGIDVVLGREGDAYGKNDSIDDIRRTLAACAEHGIIVIGTYIGNPDARPAEFEAQLGELAGLPVADVDVRLAIALRHTEYFERNEPCLIRHPDRGLGRRCGRAYFDRQNYRYQTLQFPGKIRPHQTYAIVNRFLKRFAAAPGRLRYAREMARRFPDTRPYFEQRYGAGSV